MISYKKGFVTDILKKDDNTIWISVDIDGIRAKAVNYSNLTGNVNINDYVILNTTALELKLGTGGYHFVIYNYSNESRTSDDGGHIMKLRYTPFQLKCLTAEEEDSPYHEIFNSINSLNGKIFIVATLHSMLAPIASMLKWLKPELRVNYLMTDGGALPIQFSNTVRELKEKEIIDKTITIGHAFGGDVECVNIYTGLIASSAILSSDVTIISMGPGIVGTGTKYGFSGIEQGYIVDAVNNLNGIPFIVPRISFKDSRKRHRGISHHTITVLKRICNTSGKLVIPYLDEIKDNEINKQLIDNGLMDRYEIIKEVGMDIDEALCSYDLNVTTMGRGIKDDLEYFVTLGAVARSVVKYLNKSEG